MNDVSFYVNYITIITNFTTNLNCYIKSI